MYVQLPWTRDDENRGKHTGTFGEVHVWKRIKDGSKETAVVKIPTVPQHIEKLRQEREKMLQVSHNNIVKCLSPTIFGEDYNLEKLYKNDIIWKDVLVMEFCDGGNLRKVFNKNKHGIGLNEIIHLCSDLGSALQYLHEVHHIIHRDIKPENIFLVSSDNKCRPFLYKVGDLGEVTEVMKDAGMTHVSTLQTHGTFAYMAPEQLLYDPYDGTMKMAESTDLWGFGTILSEAAFGVRPFFHDQGHHIHCDISTYCNSLMDKTDDVIYIFKEGSLNDVGYNPIHKSVIPHNNSLPDMIVKQMYSILRSALLSDRRKRGHPDPSGSYQIYNQIKALSNIKMIEVFNCRSLEKYYIEIPFSGTLIDDVFSSRKGFIINEQLKMKTVPNFETGFQIFLSKESESKILLPKIPQVLENYFSEPFPSNRKGVERSLVGFLLRLRIYLKDIVKAINIIINLIADIKQNSQMEVLIPAQTLIGLAPENFKSKFQIADFSDLLSNTDLTSDFVVLKQDIEEQSKFIECWCNTFRGLSSQSEWTDVYILVDNFKEAFVAVGERFSKLSSLCFKFIEAVNNMKEDCNNFKYNIELWLHSSATQKHKSNHGEEPKKDLKMLLEENMILYSELTKELADDIINS